MVSSEAFPDKASDRQERVVVALERLATSVESIDRSLLTLALVAHQERDERQRRLTARAQTLVDDATHADEAFDVADALLANASSYPREREVLRRHALQLESEAASAWDAVRRFETRYPQVATPGRASWQRDESVTPAGEPVDRSTSSDLLVEPATGAGDETSWYL